jgi:inner membrane protein YidH
VNALRSMLRLMPDFDGINLDLASAQLSSRRTEFSLHRTRMSADRTLMSIIRTSLSLIGFGFTIFQFFRYLRQSAGATQLPVTAARNFSLALVVLGIGMLALGMWSHVGFMLKLRALRNELAEAQVILARDKFPISTTLVVAAFLMAIGVGALVDMVLRFGGPK